MRTGGRGGGGHPKIFKKLVHQNAANTKIGASLDFPSTPIPPLKEFAKNFNHRPTWNFNFCPSIVVNNV
jgi:hypothetical protein